MSRVLLPCSPRYAAEGGCAQPHVKTGLWLRQPPRKSKNFREIVLP